MHLIVTVKKNEKCPLNGQCLTKNTVYESLLNFEGHNTDANIGSNAYQFKQRYYNHNSCFNYSKYKKQYAHF